MVNISGRSSKDEDYLYFIEKLQKELISLKPSSSMDEIESRLLMNKILLIANSASPNITIECKVKSLEEIAKEK